MRGQMSSIIYSNLLLKFLVEGSGEFHLLNCADGFHDILCEVLASTIDVLASTIDVPSVGPSSDPAAEPLVYLLVRGSLCLPAIVSLFKVRKVLSFC